MINLLHTEPKAPTGVSINAIGVGSVVVSWTASQSSCDDVIANYTVTYRLRDGTSAHTSVNTAATSVTICDLVPNAEYTVSVAAINSMGDVSVYSAETLFVVNMATTPVTVPISPSGPTATPAVTAQGNTHRWLPMCHHMICWKLNLIVNVMCSALILPPLLHGVCSQYFS